MEKFDNVLEIGKYCLRLGSEMHIVFLRISQIYDITVLLFNDSCLH